MSTPVSLEAFELAILRRSYDSAADILLELLDVLRRGGIELHGDPLVVEGVATRWMAAFMALLTAPEFRLSEDRFRRLAVHHEDLVDIAGASAYGSMALAARSLATKHAHASNAAKERDWLLKLLLACDLETAEEVEIEHLLEAAGDLAAAVYYPLVSSCVAVSDKRFEARSRLCSLAKAVTRFDMPDYILGIVNRAWFMCSYGAREDKHDFKAHVNAMIGRWLDKREAISSVVPVPPARDRPLLAVVADAYQSNHALYRCYGAATAGLRKHFTTVLLCDRNRVDDVASSTFDRVIPVDPDGDPTAPVAMLRNLCADAVFFPGTGMSHWTLPLVNARSAPIQIVAQGHPATTRSPHMDYTVGPSGWMGASECYSETVIELDDAAMQFYPLPERLGIRSMVRREPDIVRIAVNSRSFKLAPRFMSLCRELQSNAGRPLEFHFFATETGFRFHHAARSIRALIPGALVHPTTGYREYLERLGECDVHLGTFPFGGTNTVADSLSLDIPVVTLEGREPHSRIDAATIRRAGLPEWLIARSEDEYLRAATRIVERDSDRVECCRILEGLDFDAEFHDVEFKWHPDDLSSCFKWLLENHAAIQRCPRKRWAVGDRALVGNPRRAWLDVPASGELAAVEEQG